MKKNVFLINSKFASFFLFITVLMLFSCKKTSTDIQEPVQNESVCLTANEYMSYEINGGATSYVLPTDSLKLTNGYESSTFSTYFQLKYYRLTGYNSLTVNNPTRFIFDRENIVLGSSQRLYSFFCPQFIYGSNTNTSYNVNITEYGNIGEYMSGNFTALLPGMNNDGTLTGVSYNVDCCFRIKRTF